MADKATTNRVQGEGDYISAKRFDDAEQAFVKSGPVAEKAREAADALDGSEADELERARVASAQGKSLGKGAKQSTHPDLLPDEGDPHTETNLDKGLEETFPASDPVSISPGAD